MEFRFFTPDDAARLAPLFEEMQAHYRVPCPPRAAILAALDALPAGNRILLAEIGGEIAGFAAVAEIWPGPGLVKGLFLKELYVAAGRRRAGVGTGLMRRLAALAVASGHGRIDWTADREDAALLAFYARLGGRPESGRIFHRLTGEALATTAEAWTSVAPGPARWVDRSSHPADAERPTEPSGRPRP